MSCGCGRSPTGECIGWHDLTEEEYQMALEEYNSQNSDVEDSDPTGESDNQIVVNRINLGYSLRMCDYYTKGLFSIRKTLFRCGFDVLIWTRSPLLFRRKKI